jgi:hypothetical protein
MGPLTKDLMLSTLSTLNQKLEQSHPDLKISLVLGGGGAMILAHGFPRGTTDIDAIPRGVDPEILAPLVRAMSVEFNLPADWLNPHFSTFSHVLPSDYGDRLVEVFNASHLRVEALGKEDMLIMKCFAGRPKDIPHARALLRAGLKIEIVEGRMNQLLTRKIPGSQKAIDFLQELMDELE